MDQAVEKSVFLSQLRHMHGQKVIHEVHCRFTE